jgi:hypothetical protein
MIPRSLLRGEFILPRQTRVTDFAPDGRISCFRELEPAVLSFCQQSNSKKFPQQFAEKYFSSLRFHS